MSFEETAIFPSLPRVKRGNMTAIKGDPKGKNFLYTNGKSIFIRDIENPSICDVYTQHAKETYVAAYSPSGFYIASGDASGKVRIWDTTQKEHILKYEYQPISAQIKDIVWSPDSKRMIVVGQGRESYGAAFLWDSGSSVGKIDQHVKSINAVDFKTTRPYRVCTASEDYHCNFYEGPPFKYKKAIRHENFVNCARYAPCGDYFVTGGADGKLVLYDGKDGDFLDEFKSDCGKAHSGGIYGISWSPDSSEILTASADKTCKIWNVADRTVTITFKFGSTLDDMQVGCLWMGDCMLSISLSGAIKYLDRNNPDTPSRILWGHFQNITAVTNCPERKKIYSASFDGRIVAWDISSGHSEVFTGKGHTTEIKFLAVDGDTLISCAIDDTIRFTSLETQEFGSEVLALGGQPKGFCCGSDGLILVTLEKEILTIRKKQIVSKLKVHFETSSVSVHPGQTEVAVGSKNENRVYIYELVEDVLQEKRTVDAGMSNVLHVAYSPDGAFLGVCGENKKSYALRTTDYKDLGEWYGHTGRIFGLAWSPDSQYMATCGLDSHIFVHSVAEPKKSAIPIKFAHPQSAITSITWIDNNNLVSASYDCCLKLWSLKHGDQCKA